MTTQQQEQRPDFPYAHQSRLLPWTRWFIAGIILLFVAIGIIIWILTSRSAFTTILPIVIFTVLGVLIALFQWLFPVSSSPSEHPSTHPHFPQVPQDAQLVQQVQPIIVHIPTTQPLPSPSPLLDKSSYRGMIGSPPPTDPRTIQQREHVVREVYTKLIQPDITAIALTGIGGVGKSTLAALIYRYTEEQQRTHNCPFLAETLWLTVDPAVTFADLAGNLFEALDKPLPDLNNLAPQNQAVALFNALNTTDKPRLIILDQFENLLNWDKGHALTDRPGVGEWLDIINSQECNCRIVLTSRPRPVGTREYPPTYLQEYSVGGLEVSEGVALLRNQDVQGTDAELQTAVSYCAGHAFSLTLLALLLHDHHMNLEMLFKDSALWTGDIATNILDQIYMLRLNEVQRELLLAFSVYREPVPLEAAQVIISNVPKGQLSSALKALKIQHLLEASEGCYQLHAIVSDYAQSHFVEGDEYANQKAVEAVHAKATQYYLQQATNKLPPRDQRRKSSDIHDLIEAVWHYCQAAQWKEAYSLMQNEDIFNSLNRWGGNVILLELYQLLLPLNKWNVEHLQAVHIYNNLGWIYNQLGQKEESQDYFEKALRICKQVGALGEGGTTMSNLGWIYSELGHFERAREVLEQALNICREVKDRVEESRTLNNLGRVYAILGQLKRAQEYFEQALNICKEVGDREGEGWALNNLGKVYGDLGLKIQALEYLNQALRIRKAVGNRLAEGRTLKNLGSVYSELGKKEEALKCLEEALHINKEVGDREGEGMTLNKLGMFYCNEVGGQGGEGMALALYKSDLLCKSLEHKELALKYYTEALHILKEVRQRRVEGMTLNNIGLFYAKSGESKRAQMFYKDALSIFKEIGGNWDEGTILHNIGVLYFKQHRYNISLASFLLAKNIFKEIQNPNYDVTLGWIDRLHQKLGDEPFFALLAPVESQIKQIVDQALQEGI